MDGRRTLYGRRRGRPLRSKRQALVERLLPALALDPDRLGAGPAALFPDPVRDLWLEVGFGAGEHLLQQAVTHPDIGFIGCEPYINGVARLLADIDTADPRPRNIRLYTDDARTVLDRLPEGCLGRVFVLFPDPWPKSRHHRRRFVAPPQLDALARAMRPGAELRLATDHVGYLRWMLFHLLDHPAFRWCARGPADWRRRTADWPATRYEEKALEKGIAPAYLRFERVASLSRPGGGKPQ